MEFENRYSNQVIIEDVSARRIANLLLNLYGWADSFQATLVAPDTSEIEIIKSGGELNLTITNDSIVVKGEQDFVAPIIGLFFPRTFSDS